MEFQAPANRISERGLKVWRIMGMIYSLFVLIVAIATLIVGRMFDWPIWIGITACCVAVLFFVLSVVVVPSVSWQRWRYEVREQEIELQHGVFIVKRTLVPMIRVQHVDTSQGPILKKFQLATISISTAATIHQIPAVDLQEAEHLRHSISALARVAEEDV